MADLFWTGIDQNWNLDSNWSLSSGGPGDGWIPTAADNVFIDGGGYILIWPFSPIECNNMTLLAGMTEMLLIESSGVINGDFEQQDGYFGPTGGPGHVIEFKGNFLKTGGTFSVGTGVGKDPECVFSGIGKTYQLNDVGAASFQNLSITGEYIFSGTRLTQANVVQKLSVTGILTIDKYNLTVCNIELDGVNAGFDVFTGTIKGTGRFWYGYREGSTIPNTGTIEIRYFRLELRAGLVSGSIDEDLVVDGWNNVHTDWSHQGTEPWIHDDDGDTNYITIPAEASEIGSYDEHYTIEDIDSDAWTSINLTKVKIHLKGRLYDGVGGHASLVIVRAYLWDGAVWQDGGVAIFPNTVYADRVCSTDLSALFTSVSQIDGMRLKLEIDNVIGGGADKGGINITQSWVEIEGTAFWNPIFTLPPRVWSNPSEVEIEYTAADQIFRLDAGKHTFNRLTIHGNDVAITTAEFDCDTNIAQMWCENKFDIYKDAFPDGTFTLKFGDGVHVFRGSIDFYFSYSSVTTQLVVEPGEGTLLLWPKGRQVIPVP